MRELTYSKALNEALIQSFERDERVIILGEDIASGGNFGITAGMLDRFGPSRVINTPISEAAFTGAAIGAAMTGLRPVADVHWIDFSTCAMDQIVNQMAKIHYMFGGRGKLPMVVRVAIGAGRGTGAQHSQSFHAFFVHTPGLYVAIPSTPYDVKGLMNAAIENENPVVFVEHRFMYASLKGEVPEEYYTVPFGKADIKRKGKDITIVATAAMVHRSLNVAEECAKDGIEIEIVDPRTLRPLDKESILESVKKTGRLIVADEGPVPCGVASEISAVIAEEAIEYLQGPILRVGPPDTPVPYSPALEKFYIPDESDVMGAIKKMKTYM